MFHVVVKWKNSLLGVACTHFFSELWDGYQTCDLQRCLQLRRYTGRKEGLMT